MRVTRAQDQTIETLAMARAILDAPEHTDNALRPVVQELVDLVHALERRLNKISTISDRYQAQLKGINERLEETARTDLLTGLPNRRGMLERIFGEMNRAQRNNLIFSVLILDVDHFKSVNDTYGHLAGDAVLSGIADLMRAALRSSDVCARWGGEEFLLLLPETDATAAQNIAERLRQGIMEHTFSSQEIAFSLTASIGGVCSSSVTELDTLIQTADTMLYRAKAFGRNQVQFTELNESASNGSSMTSIAKQ